MNYIIILAAGKGTRMKNDTAKVLNLIIDKPMIKYIIDTIKKINLGKIICVIGHKKEIVKETLGDEFLYAIQPIQNGTAKAVLACENLIEDDSGYSLIIPGDTPLITPDILESLIETHNKNNNSLTVGTMRINNPYGYGRIIEKEGVIKIVEEKDLDSNERQINIVNSGIMCVQTKELFSSLKEIKPNNNSSEYYLTDIVQEIGLNHKVGIFEINDSYKAIGVNDLNMLSMAEEYLINDKINQLLKAGVKIQNPSSVVIGIDVIIMPGAVILAGSIITGNSLIKRNAVIGPNSEIIDSVVGEDSKVRFSVVVNSSIGNNVSVGPFAHIRENSIVGDNNRIGNFVEMKKTTTKKYTKASHLAYMGDCECGANVNVGCGVITVNYDGKFKHKTVIGDNSFIGCNSNLVAPLNIGKNCFIAAGSTITNNLENNDFAISRCEQITKKGYAKKYKMGE